MSRFLFTFPQISYFVGYVVRWYVYYGTYTVLYSTVWYEVHTYRRLVRILQNSILTPTVSIIFNLTNILCYHNSHHQQKSLIYSYHNWQREGTFPSGSQCRNQCRNQPYVFYLFAIVLSLFHLCPRFALSHHILLFASAFVLPFFLFHVLLLLFCIIVCSFFLLPSLFLCWMICLL